MNTQLKIRMLAVCAAVAVATGAARTALADAPILTHRWSFNGDYSDSVGDADAVNVGERVSLYGNRVHLGGYDYTAQGHIVLGTNRLDTAEATIEIWARHDSVRRWSRIFDYGSDTNHYFTLAWTQGLSLSKDRAGAKNPTESAVDNTMAPYEIGVDYHIAVTFRRQDDGSTFIRWQRRDAATGELQKTGTMTMPDGMQNIVDPVLYLGHSQYTADRDALAAYDEVRIWRGVLTDEQLAASAAAGPDAAIAVMDGAPSFTPAEPPEPPAQKAAVPNGGFRIMTYNVQFCYDEVSTIVPDRTAARIIAENPDFCCVNEVRDSAQHAEATLLAKVTGMHKSFGGNESGSNGNLILSKEEPLGTETIFLQMSSSGYGNRYCHICEFTNFCIAVTHLDTAQNSSVNAEVQASNAVAIATIRDAFAKYAKPVFLCGDWNTRPNWDNMAKFNEFMEILSPTNGVRTYHGHKATGGSIIDYISVDKAHRDDFFVQRSFVVDDIVTSDHNPVLAEFYCRPAASDLSWVDERFLTTGRTGTWSPDIGWDPVTWTAELDGDAVFTANLPSGGNVVTMTVTASADAMPDEEGAAPDDIAQGAVRIGTNGCFQVWTKELKVESGELKVGEDDAWLDVEAEDVTPQAGVEYTFKCVFDYTAGTYSVEVQTGLTGFTRLREKNPVNPVNPVQNFPLASAGDAISAIRFVGDGALTSIRGEYVEAEGFSEKDEVLLKDNAPVILDKARAAWLNSCKGGKSAVGTAAAGLSAADFDAAYLLNLDITGDPSYTFAITGIDVDPAAGKVTIGVTLNRTGAIAETINGVLKFYGAATVEAFACPDLAPLVDVTLSDDDFSEGGTATAEIPLKGDTPPAFFKATIE